MKKTLSLALIFGCLSCAGLSQINAEMGMSIEEFRKKNVGESLVELNPEYTVYRVMASRGPDKFVYFQDGKLVKMDEGEWLPQVVVNIK